MTVSLDSPGAWTTLQGSSDRVPGLPGPGSAATESSRGRGWEKTPRSGHRGVSSGRVSLRRGGGYWAGPVPKVTVALWLLSLESTQVKAML